MAERNDWGDRGRAGGGITQEPGYKTAGGHQSSIAHQHKSLERHHYRQGGLYAYHGFELRGCTSTLMKENISGQPHEGC